MTSIGKPAFDLGALAGAPAFDFTAPRWAFFDDRLFVFASDVSLIEVDRRPCLCGLDHALIMLTRVNPVRIGGGSRSTCFGARRAVEGGAS